MYLGHREMRTTAYCWWECKLVQSPQTIGWKFLKKLKTELPCNPAILFLAIQQKKMKILIQKDTRTSMFIAAFCTTAKICKQPKCPSTDKWIEKIEVMYIIAYIYTHNGILLSHRKELNCIICNNVDEPRGYYTQ